MYLGEREIFKCNIRREDEENCINNKQDDEKMIHKTTQYEYTHYIAKSFIRLYIFATRDLWSFIRAHTARLNGQNTA